MFSYLSRGYGTWEGIAKLEKPDSAIAPNHGNYDILPPIKKDQYHFYDQHFDHDGLYKIPQEEFKFPEMPKNSVHIPKTYSTKRGALLLYSEGCFVPGSRRLKKRPRFKRQKEQRLQTLKGFTDLIMDYKKNGCDPLLLEQLWRQMSGSARDVQPGYSPKRYLGHLSHTFDPEQWRKLIETGSLKSFGTADDCYLPSLLPEYDDHLHRRPPPYKTMSLPPVSPSSSMLGSFTFYKHALSTGAASMVSLPSIDSDTIDNQLSANTAGTFVESLAERLAEVESEAGFKKDYETLTAKEKEDLLTQLLMDVTLHNQGDVITVPTQTMEGSSTVNTDISYLSDTKGSKSHESLESYHSAKTLSSEKTMSITSNKTTKSSTSKKSLRSSQRPKSDDTSKSLKSVPSRTTSVCSLPPIVPKESAPDSVDVENRSEKASLSSSRSGLGLVVDDFEIGLNGIDIEINDNSFYLAEYTDFGMERKYSETRSLRSEKSFSEHSLIDALNIQDGESLHQLTVETKSLKSLASSDGLINRTGRIGESLSRDGVIGESKTADGDLANGMVHGDYGVSDGILSGDGGGSDGGSVGTGYCVASDGNGGGKYGDDIGDGAVYGVGSDGGGVASDGSGDGGRYGDGYAYSENEGDGPDSISISSDGHPDYHHEPTKQTQAPHMSLSTLQDEVRLVATEVLSRPNSGRILAEDAEMATFLLLERMQGLLDPALTETARVSSAVPKKVRPLGQPRNGKAKGKRRVRSAEATLASRKLVSPEEKQVEQVSKSEEEPAEHVSSKEQEPHVEDDSLSKTDESDLSVDDVIVTMDTVQDTGPVKDGAQSLEVGSTTPSPEGELLTVKDLQSDKKQEETTKPDVTKMKETKENVQKGGKVKKGGKAKRVAKGKKKRASIARARNEPPKTPPFRAGLVPEAKPPKGLEEKTDGAPKTGKQASPDLHEKTQPKTTDPNKTSEIDGIPARVDAETGELEHRVSPARPEKSPSPTGRKTPPEEKKSVSREDQLSARAQPGSPRAQNGSPRAQIDSPREKSPHEKTPSSRDKTPSSRDKTPSSRDKTPSPREQKPSPREQKVCPRDRDAVFSETVNANRENVNTNVVTESVASTREPSPEVVLTEKQRRANARASQRAAAAERRRQEVERKRREREEARKRAQEEEARLEVLRKESEEEMKRREEERRIQKEQEERERMRLDTEQNERARQERLMIERQRQAREDWKRKKEQLIAQRQFEEELRKERECVELQIEEERRREYAEKIAHLEDEERERLMEERRLDEERIKREIQEEKERREAERLRMLEERRQMEEDLAAASERQLARRTFLETLLRDFQNLLLDQRITRAFTFSYFDIMPWFKDRWRDLEEDRPSSKRPSTQLDTVPEESEIDLEQAV